jgi:hypothetical protein
MHRVTREAALWCAVAILASAPRLVRLDFLLTNAEATVAMTSLAALRGEPVFFLNPLFGWLQTLIFAIFGATEPSARLIQALSGVGLCLLPAALRLQLGRTRALLLAGLLALSPTLWFVSRESGGAMLAWMLAFAAHCAWHRDRPTLTAVLLGVLLASGSDAVVPLIVTMAASVVARPFDAARLPPRATPVVGVAFILAATGLLMRPSGLGDAFNGYATWVRSLWSADPLSAGRLMLGFLTSELVAWVGAIFALAMFARARQLTRSDAAWLAWMVIGLLLLVVVTSRSAASLVPVMIGCAGLASWAYDTLFASVQRWADWRREGAIAGVTFVLLMYAGLGVLQYAGQGRSAWLISALVSGLLILALVAAGSLGMDYGPPLRGVALSGIAVLLLYVLGAGVQMNLVRSHNPAEPYRREAAALGLETLRDSVRQMSARAMGEPDALAVQIAGEPPPALQWALRGQRNLILAEGPSNAGIVLTPAPAKPQSPGSFIGTVYDVVVWAPLSEVRCTGLPQGGMDCLSLARWLAFRETSDVRTERWLFWLRDDVAQKASGRR